VLCGTLESSALEVAALELADDELVGASVDERVVDGELVDRSVVLPVSWAPRAAVPSTWLAQPASSRAAAATTAASRESHRITTPDCSSGVRLPALMRRDLAAIVTGNLR